VSVSDLGEGWDAHQHVSAFAKTSLIGREDVLGTLQTWIDDPAVRVIALSGTHMMGKSRVALDGASHCWKVQPVDPMRFLNSAAVRYWVQNGMA
jgi:hypothetical protein